MKSDHTDWGRYLNEFMFALNSFKHDATGYSPAEIFLNRKILSPGEWVVDASTAVENPVSMFETAKRKMARQAICNKAYYDGSRSQVKFKKGDKVLLKSHPLSNLARKFSAKLAPKWRGPYHVISRQSPVNFIIGDSFGSECHIAHVDQSELML